MPVEVLLWLITADLIDSSDKWIFVKFRRLSPSSTSHNFFLCLIYLKRSLGQDLESILPNLQQVLEEINHIRMYDPLIIGGDLNAWIGHDGSYSSELFEDTALSPDKLLPPTMSDLRGSVLSDFFKDNGLILLNGRTPGDSPARFT